MKENCIESATFNRTLIAHQNSCSFILLGTFSRCFRLTAGYVLKIDSMMSAVRLYLIPFAPSYLGRKTLVFFSKGERPMILICLVVKQTVSWFPRSEGYGFESHCQYVRFNRFSISDHCFSSGVL